MPDFSHIELGRHYTFGSDPEVFTRDNKGQIVPAFTFLPPKDKPKKVIIDYQGNRYDSAIYNDGFQAELRAKPHGCIAFVVDSIRGGLKAIWEESGKASLVLDNAPMIPIKMLKDTPDEHVILGCDPSNNAYHMGGKVVGDPRKLRYRFTGGHIHMSGWQVPEDFAEREKLFVPYVKALDATVGVYFVAAGAHLESHKRREYYGLAGEYRLPEHGLEYRVLSSTILAHPGITNLAFELTRGTLALVDNKAMKLWIADKDEVIGIINENNQKAARAIIRRNKDLFRVLVGMGRYDSKDVSSTLKTVTTTYQMGLEGIDSVVKDPTDFVTNWKFKGEWHGHCDGRGESWTSLCYKR